LAPHPPAQSLAYLALRLAHCSLSKQLTDEPTLALKHPSNMSVKFYIFSIILSMAKNTLWQKTGYPHNNQ
jgi:hypothetical protein